MMKRLIVLLLSLTMLFTLFACSGQGGIPVIEKTVNTAEGEYYGKTVILHSNDVHGAIDGYGYIAKMKKDIEAAGGTVILADAGDFSNGSTYVSISKGESAVTLMDAAGYDIVALGNHELDFGFDNVKTNLSKGTFKTVCSNVFKDGKPVFDADVIVKVGDLKIGFFALLTPETQTKVNPAQIQGIKFTEKEDLYKAASDEVEKLKPECDIIICLAHLGVDQESAGNRSTDVCTKVQGIDFIIDGHSHTVMESGENGEKIQSTGTEFLNVGMIVIDNASRKIESNHLISTDSMVHDETVLALANNIKATVDEQYSVKFATSAVDLDATKEYVRSQETNLGDLICDALVWSVTNSVELKVNADHVVAVTNGGGIRANITAGDVTRNDIKAVLPFGNTIALNYIKGTELLEALEASVNCTPEPIGGFPQIAGMKIQIDCTKEFDKGEEYPDSTYCAPKSIRRVSILEVNGKPFSPDDTYAVITNNFCAAGGDTYYAFKRAYDEGNGFDTSIVMDEGLVNFILYSLGGEIGKEYEHPQGRITVILPEN